MLYKFMILSGIITLLVSCAENNLPPDPVRYHSAVCLSIKDQLNKKHPPQLQTRMLPTERAKLMKEYKQYDCGE